MKQGMQIMSLLLDEKLCLGRRQQKKQLGAALNKNMLQAALGEKLGAAAVKKTAVSCVR